jgi:hypothetical protein
VVFGLLARGEGDGYGLGSSIYVMPDPVTRNTTKRG